MSISVSKREIGAFKIFNNSKGSFSKQAVDENTNVALSIIPVLLHAQFQGIFSEPSDDLAPAGIMGFRPSQDALELTKKTIPEWKASQIANNRPMIEFLSIMGSLGSIAFNESSDIDYWCCVKDGIKANQRESLQRKITSIENWIDKTFNVEVHIFITSPHDLRENRFGQASTESCGSALGKLLKEEYFRSSLHVAGSIPVWWACPGGLSKSSYQSLAQKHLAEAIENVVDIGTVETLPKNEFLGASLWQLNKAIDSPYKSILKMALLMDYVHGEDDQLSLADELKSKIHAKPNIMEELDSYVLMFERASAFFSVFDHGRWLDLLRKCFFIKAKANVLRWYGSKRQPSQVREKVMLNLVQTWDWPKDTIEKYQNFGAMNPREIMAFKDECEQFLSLCSDTIQEKLSDLKSDLKMTPSDFKKMFNRFSSHYSMNRNRLEWIYEPFRSLLLAKHFSIVKTPEENEWTVYQGVVEERVVDVIQEKSKVRSFKSFSSSIVWLVHNGLAIDSSTIHYKHEMKNRFSSNVKQFGGFYRMNFGTRKPYDLDRGDFLNQATPEKWLLFINVLPYTERDVIAARALVRGRVQKTEVRFRHIGYLESNHKQHRDTELVKKFLCTCISEKNKSVQLSESTPVEYQMNNIDSRFSNQDDPLNAWNESVCLVRSAGLVERNTWGETVVFDFNHSSWLPCVMIRILNSTPEHMSLDLSKYLSLYVGEGLHDNRKLRARITKLMKDIIVFFRGKQHQRDEQESLVKVFVFKIDGRAHFLINQKGNISHLDYEDIYHGLVGLQGRHPNKIIYGFDEEDPFLHFLSNLNNRQQFDKVEVFYRQFKDGVNAITFDEFGHISIDFIPKKAQRVRVPRHAYSVALCLKKKSDDPLFNKAPCLSLHWIDEENGKLQIKDASSSMFNMVSQNIKRLKPLRMVLKPESLQGFLAIYSMSNQIPVLDGSIEGTVKDVGATVRSFRTVDSCYRVFLSDIKLDMNSGYLPSLADLPTTTSDWLNMKVILEKALTESMRKVED